MEGDCWDLESLGVLVVALSTKWRMIVGTWESLGGLFVALSTKGRLLGLGVFEGTVSDTANKRAIVGTWGL